MNTNPLKARLAQRRRRKAGDLAHLMKALWGAIGDIEVALALGGTTEETFRGAHAMAACANAYARLIALAEYEPRLAQIEKYLEEQRRGYAEAIG